MTVFVAILGLGFLILIHEAGHFFTALAVGMRPAPGPWKRISPTASPTTWMAL